MVRGWLYSTDCRFRFGYLSAGQVRSGQVRRSVTMVRGWLYSTDCKFRFGYLLTGHRPGQVGSEIRGQQMQKVNRGQM